MHFVTEEGTFVNKTGTFKQTSRKWHHSFSSVRSGHVEIFAGSVQVLMTSCQKNKHHIHISISERDAGCVDVWTRRVLWPSEKETKSILVSDCTWS